MREPVRPQHSLQFLRFASHVDDDPPRGAVCGDRPRLRTPHPPPRERRHDDQQRRADDTEPVPSRTAGLQRPVVRVPGTFDQGREIVRGAGVQEVEGTGERQPVDCGQQDEGKSWDGLYWF